MRKLRTVSMAVVLTLAFATYGFAGIIPTPPEAPPPAPDPTASSIAASLVVVLIQSAVR